MLSCRLDGLKVSKRDERFDDHQGFSRDSQLREPRRARSPNFRAAHLVFLERELYWHK
jgi:hypothetical protein